MGLDLWTKYAKYKCMLCFLSIVVKSEALPNKKKVKTIQFGKRKCTHRQCISNQRIAQRDSQTATLNASARNMRIVDVQIVQNDDKPMSASDSDWHVMSM